jgi:hypothetical protein
MNSARAQCMSALQIEFYLSMAITFHWLVWGIPQFNKVIINENTSVTVTVPVQHGNNNSTVSLSSYTRLFRQNQNVNLKSVMGFVLISRFHAQRSAIFPLRDGNFIPQNFCKWHTEVHAMLTHVTSFDDYKNFNFPLSRRLATFLLEEGNSIPLNCRTWNTEATCYPTGSVHSIWQKWVGRSVKHIYI